LGHDSPARSIVPVISGFGGGALVDAGEQFLNPQYTGDTQNDYIQRAQTGYKPPPKNGLLPDPADARRAAFDEAKNELRRRRAYQTLFTGGQGLLDQASTASNVLLGN